MLSAWKLYQIGSTTNAATRTRPDDVGGHPLCRLVGETGTVAVEATAMPRDHHTAVTLDHAVETLIGDDDRREMRTEDVTIGPESSMIARTKQDGHLPDQLMGPNYSLVHSGMGSKG